MKKFLVLSILLVLLVSACGPEAPNPSVTPTPTPIHKGWWARCEKGGEVKEEKISFTYVKLGWWWCNFSTEDYIPKWDTCEVSHDDDVEATLNYGECFNKVTGQVLPKLW